MTRHPQVVIRAPHRNWFLAPREFRRTWKIRRGPIHLLKDAVRMIILFPEDLLMKKRLIWERPLQTSSSRWRPISLDVRGDSITCLFVGTSRLATTLRSLATCINSEQKYFFSANFVFYKI